MTIEEKGNKPNGIIAKAICSFPNGISKRLFMTHLSTADAFILSMKPPPLQSSLSVTIYMKKSNPLPPLEVRVIGVHVDPVHAERSGFEVVFTNMDDVLLDRIATAVETIHDDLVAETHRKIERGRYERRKDARVNVELGAVIKFHDTIIHGTIRNLSISGALMILGNDPVPLDFRPGAEIELTIIAASYPEAIATYAQLIWLSGATPEETGVRFFDLNELMENRIEGIILDELAKGFLE